MDTIRSAQVAGWVISLLARDQYNDYSVAYDYTVEFRRSCDQYGRRWDVGSQLERARRAFELCRSWACANPRS